MFRLDGKVLVLTGASGLIGSALLPALRDAGAQVVAGSRDAAKAKSRISSLPPAPKGSPAPEYLDLDISKPASVKSFFKKVESRFGKLDVLINNAFPRTKDWNAKFEDTEVESLFENLLSHGGGYYFCCQEAAKMMMRQKSGCILNFGSIYGEFAPRFRIYEGTKMNSAPAYPLIKGGVHTLTRYLASYLGPHGIRVNCVAPGGIRDDSAQDPIFIKNYCDLTPMGRMGAPGDVVGPVLFLCSKAADYVTGQVLFVDGGWTAC